MEAHWKGLGQERPHQAVSSRLTAGWVLYGDGGEEG